MFEVHVVNVEIFMFLYREINQVFIAHIGCKLFNNGFVKIHNANEFFVKKKKKTVTLEFLTIKAIHPFARYRASSGYNGVMSR